MLALAANATVSVDDLIDGLWGSDPPATAPKMVQLYVSQLRRLIASDDAQILTHGRGYELRMPADAVDAARLECLVDEAGRAPAAPNGAAREALGLWRGPALGDVAGEPFAAPEIRRLEQLRLTAAELAIEGDLAAGRAKEVLPELERLVEQHPLRERLHAHRMLALYRSGRQAEALDAYAAARRRRVDLQSGRVTRRIVVGGHPVALVHGHGLGLGGDRGVRARREHRSALRRGRRGDRRRQRACCGRGGARCVWSANRQDGTVSRIDSSTDRVTYTVPAGREPVALAIAGGALWVADAGGAVLRLDPRRGSIASTVRTGSAPAGLAAVGDEVWVTTAAPSAAHRGGTLRVGSAPLSLDPADAFFSPTAPISELAYDGLLGYRRVGGTPGARLVGALAAAVPAPTDGGRRYRFRLRRSMRYSNGAAVRAGDFRASLERVLVLSSVASSLFDASQGAAGCVTAPRRCDLSRAITADERTGVVTIRLRRPDPSCCTS